MLKSQIKEYVATYVHTYILSFDIADIIDEGDIRTDFAAIDLVPWSNGEGDNNST